MNPGKLVGQNHDFQILFGTFFVLFLVFNNFWFKDIGFSLTIFLLVPLCN